MLGLRRADAGVRRRVRALHRQSAGRAPERARPSCWCSFAIGWAALLAALGALPRLRQGAGRLAGRRLARLHRRTGRRSPRGCASLRDFLLLFFFIALGASLDLSTLGASVGPAIVFAAFVLIGNPLIVLAIMGAMGYRKRTGFLAGLTVAQISEFSLIFMAMGVSLGHVGEEALGLVTLVGLITIAASTYMITFSHRLYAWLEPVAGRVRVPPRRGPGGRQRRRRHALRRGRVRPRPLRRRRSLDGAARRTGMRRARRRLRPRTRCARASGSAGYDALFGDASDPEFVGAPAAGTACGGRSPPCRSTAWA
ncbi:MAG: cation:proton antiporter [Xanthomonadales bacterium]|nr:cation:proton antiporter [Xanthomonadales bacterium]